MQESCVSLSLCGPEVPSSLMLAFCELRELDAFWSSLCPVLDSMVALLHVSCSEIEGCIPLSNSPETPVLPWNWSVWWFLNYPVSPSSSVPLSVCLSVSLPAFLQEKWGSSLPFPRIWAGSVALPDSRDLRRRRLICLSSQVQPCHDISIRTCISLL